MSFTLDVKEELALVKQPSCCNIAECYGMLRFGRAFGFDKIIFQTASESAAKRLAHRLRSNFGILAESQCGGSTRQTYRIRVLGEADRKKLMIAFGYKKIDEAYPINMELAKKDCCLHSFLRGVFLACGQVSDPEKDYRLELCVGDEALAAEIHKIFAEMGIEMKTAHRAGLSLLYLKDSAAIEDLLTLLGATNSAIIVMQSKIYKNMRNKVNRIKNCETANIFKSVDAAIEQRTAIELLEKRGKLNSLPPELISAAQLRTDNPDASLSELCRISSEPITRSGLNHRFTKIIELAKELG